MSTEITTKIEDLPMVAIEQEKIQSISLLNENQKNEIMKAIPFVKIPYFPISEGFIKRFILNDKEYPLLESKLSQSAIEMRARLNRLVDANYTFNKTLLEIKGLELDIEDIKNDKNISFARMEVNVAMKELEIKSKKYLAQSTKASLDESYNEFLSWAKTVADCVEAIKQIDPNVKTFEDINYNSIREAEMGIKVQMYKAMKEQGMELTPSQRVFVD